MVAEERERAAQEQREHASPQQLPLGDLAVGVQECPAALGPSVDQKSVRSTAGSLRERSIHDHRRRPPIASDQEMPCRSPWQRQTGPATGCAPPRRGAPRREARVPEALSLEPVRPVASPLDTEWHVGAPDWSSGSSASSSSPWSVRRNSARGGRDLHVLRRRDRRPQAPDPGDTGLRRTATRTLLTVRRRASAPGSAAEERRQRREVCDLVPEAGDHHRLPWKPERPPVVHEVDGGVPALAEELNDRPRPRGTARGSAAGRAARRRGSPAPTRAPGDPRRVWRNIARCQGAMGVPREGRREPPYRMRYGGDRGRRPGGDQRGLATAGLPPAPPTARSLPPRRVGLRSPAPRRASRAGRAVLSGPPNRGRRRTSRPSSARCPP